MPLSAEQALEHIEQHAAYALKNSVYNGFHQKHLITPDMRVEAATKSAQWRRAVYPVTFTHQETGETYDGHGILEIGFDQVVPKVPVKAHIPSHQLRFRIGMTAIDSPVPKRRVLRTPDWRKQWRSDTPARALLIANYNRVDPIPKEQDPTGILESTARLPFSLVHSENGQPHRILDLSLLQNPERSLPELTALDSYLTFVKPRPASIRQPRKGL